jgi:stalled ribosome alternative rescue factor ArfA
MENDQIKTTNCILCDCPITDANDSREHVFQNAIGGRLTTRGFLCRACNSSTGDAWDAELARQFNLLSLTFGISRQRGELPAQRINTTAGEQLKLLPEGGFALDKPSYSETDTAAGRQIAISARDMNEARKMLEGAKRKYPQIDVEKLLAEVDPVTSYPKGLVHLPFQFGGHEAGRALVKSTLAFAHHVGIDVVRDCATALAYLKGGDAAPFGFFYTDDLVTPRVAGQAFHCVAVAGDPASGLLLGYIEHFGFQRAVVCLSETYTGAAINRSHAIDPTTGLELDLKVRLSFTREELAEIYAYKHFPDDVREDALKAVLAPALLRQRQAEQEKVFGDAVRQVYERCGFKDDERLTDEQQAQLIGRILERLQPYLLHQIMRRPRPNIPPPA